MLAGIRHRYLQLHRLCRRVGRHYTGGHHQLDGSRRLRRLTLTGGLADHRILGQIAVFGRNLHILKPALLQKAAGIALVQSTHIRHSQQHLLGRAGAGADINGHRLVRSHQIPCLGAGIYALTLFYRLAGDGRYGVVVQSLGGQLFLGHILTKAVAVGHLNATGRLGHHKGHCAALHHPLTGCRFLLQHRARVSILALLAFLYKNIIVLVGADDGVIGLTHKVLQLHRLGVQRTGKAHHQQYNSCCKHQHTGDHSADDLALALGVFLHHRLFRLGSQIRLGLLRVIHRLDHIFSRLLVHKIGIVKCGGRVLDDLLHIKEHFRCGLVAIGRVLLHSVGTDLLHAPGNIRVNVNKPLGVRLHLH